MKSKCAWRRASSIVGAALAGIALTLPLEAQTAPVAAHWFRGTGAPIKVTGVGVPLQRIASFALPAGSWSLHGSAMVAVNDVVFNKVVHKGSVSCSFADGADGFTVTSPSPSGTFGYATGMMVPVSFGAALTFAAPITVTLACNKPDAVGDVSLSNVQLVAEPVSSVIRH